jgi:hypothetical protein
VALPNPESKVSPSGTGSRALAALVLVALGLFFLAAIAGDNFIDPDAFHLMALFRESLRLGWIPIQDRFAYTPTVVPCVHHEWGTGALLYLATETLGAGGILFWKYSLAVLLALTWFALHRGKGTPIAVVAVLCPVGILLVATGFSTVRAHVFTLLFTAILLLFLERDRRGDRGWILPWLVVHFVWLNLHAGFVVGSLLFGLHIVEQRVRRAPVRHLLLVAAGMAALVFANPYGWRYVPALIHGLTLDRSIVSEWDPIWKEAPEVLAVFGFSLLLCGYALGRRGWRGTSGIVLAAASAAVACLHQRNASIFGVVWLSLVPGWIDGTPLGDALSAWSASRPRALAAIGTVVALASACVVIAREPWYLRVPANPGEHESLLYPAGAVRYLDESRFEGNLMVPFTVGAYVSWKLYPRVRVSFDGRLEAAYPPQAAKENRDFYGAREGWHATLEKYPTDLVLAPSASRIASALSSGRSWKPCYRDDAYAIFARPGLELPAADRRGVRIEATFP